MTTRRPQYDPSDLNIFKMYHQEQGAVDVVVRSLEDKLACVEVHRW